jgi:hypothetical protein
VAWLSDTCACAPTHEWFRGECVLRCPPNYTRDLHSTHAHCTCTDGYYSSVRLPGSPASSSYVTLLYRGEDGVPADELVPCGDGDLASAHLRLAGVRLLDESSTPIPVLGCTQQQPAVDGGSTPAPDCIDLMSGQPSRHWYGARSGELRVSFEIASTHHLTSVQVDLGACPTEQETPALASPLRVALYVGANAVPSGEVTRDQLGQLLSAQVRSASSSQQGASTPWLAPILWEDSTAVPQSCAPPSQEQLTPMLLQCIACGDAGSSSVAPRTRRDHCVCAQGLVHDANRRCVESAARFAAPVFSVRGGEVPRGARLSIAFGQLSMSQQSDQALRVLALSTTVLQSNATADRTSSMSLSSVRATPSLLRIPYTEVGGKNTRTPER